MKLELLLTVMALAPATLARLWGGRDDDVAKLDNEDLQPLGKWTSTTTTWETIDDTPTDALISVSTVVFVEHLYTTPGYSTWLNFKSESWTSTSTTFTTTTVTHIPHIVYSTDSGASKIQLAKRSTVSVTDWVTVTRDPDNPEGTTEASSSSETLTSPPMGSPEAPPSSATAATTTASSSSSEAPSPANSSTSASPSPSSTSAVSGAPPITSLASSEESTPTPTSSVDSSSSSLAAPPAPVTSTAPIPSESLTEPAGPPSSSESLPPVSSSDLSSSSSTTTNRHRHPSTLRTLTTGFSAPISSTVTFIMSSHDGTHFSEALAPSSEELAPAAPTLSENLPPSLGDEVTNSVTAPFTLTLTAPPATSTSVRCDDSWCSNDGTSYCMRWDGISGTNSFGIVTPGEVFTTIGLCTKTVYTQNTQVTTDDGGSPVPAVTPLRPGSDRMRLA
ncbi:hypothetical protein INS49_006759 [Diaporthe citri]|uniref:uncharacterized protein n=1 Tax=Diaporthe citri TaxID=83186 RepID=UPI001C81FB2F|nr:uncharacterized protein INS49_006759 [Diaporthe citri]KAG6365152.1 hypothetical protein INS49_006759 [Diaporthe citri]